MSCGVSSSSQQYKLALNILGEHFGPLVRVSQLSMPCIACIDFHTSTVHSKHDIGSDDVSYAI